MSRFLASAAIGMGACWGFANSAPSAVACDKKPSKYSSAFKDHESKPLDTVFRPMKLGEVINLTSETAIFRFLLPNAEDAYFLVPCSTLQAQHRMGSAAVDTIQRMYTPVSPNGTKGYFDLIVKKQKRGRMTEHLFSMQVGESLSFRIVDYKMQYKKNQYKNIGLIGAGTGITPLLQVIRAVCADEDDTTNVSLLYANPTQRRILLKGMIDDLVKKSGGKFKAHFAIDHVVDNEPYDGLIGLIDEAMVRKTMPPPSPDTMLMVCGSDKLMNHMCGLPMYVMKAWSSGLALQPAASNTNNLAELGGVLRDIGYKNELVYRF